MSKYASKIGIPLDTGNLVILARLCLKLSELLVDSDAGIGWLQHATLDVERAERSKYPVGVFVNAKEDKEDVNFTKDWVRTYLMNLFKNSNSTQGYVLLVERHIPILEHIMNHESLLNRSTAVKLLSEKLNELYRMLYIRLLGKSVGGRELEEFKIPTENRRWTKWIETRGGIENIPVDAETSEILGKLSDMLSGPEQPLKESRGGKQKSTIRKLIVRANKIINRDGKDIEPIKIWVDDYLKNIRHSSSSFQSYFNLLNRDMRRLDDIMERLEDFMFPNRSLMDDSWLSIIIACKMLKERERHLYEIFSLDVRGESADPNFIYYAECLRFKLLRELVRFQNSTREVSLNSYQVIGCLTVTKVIGVGSDGIDVLEGYYHEGYCYDNRRPVAVKRFRNEYYSLVAKENGHLIESVKHANITTCFGVESNEDFHYICLEPYLCSLYNLIVENGDGKNKLDLWTNGFASQLLKNLMWDIAVGLSHLHTLKIVHGDLKPHHVLVIKTSMRVTAKISHIGISTTRKQNIILENMRSLTGWQPREVLRGENQGASVDLFSLGCIIFFCITQGKHPFGEEDFERDANIIGDEKNLFLIEDFPEAFDLISRLLNSNPELRPKVEEVIHHPLFWDSERQKTFLLETNKRLEDQNSQLLKTLEGVSGCKAWNTKIDSEFLKERIQHRQSHGYRPYEFNSVRDLLLLIRNCLVHYDQFSVWSKTTLGSYPEGVLKYFSTRFPKLFMDVYNVISEHDKKN